MLRPGTEAGRLVGRAAELERLGVLLDRARGGRGGSLVVEGTPGVGKSALLRALGAPDLLVLSTTGVESEVGLPFAGLAELVAPVIAHGDGLPEAQRAALRAALALDAPAGAERVLVLQALVALLETAASGRALLLLVDDVQWLDASSQEAIAFLARRAERLPLALVAVRSLRGEPYAPWPEVPRLRLSDLAREDALALARAGGLAPAVAEALVDAVGGNPLALVEAPAELSAAQRDGIAALPDPLPTGERLRRAYAARVAALPAPTQAALLLAAASSDGDTATLLRALGGAADAGRGADDADRGAGAVDRGADDADRGAGAVDRGAGAVDRGAGAVDRGADDADRGAGAVTIFEPAEDAGLIALAATRVRFSHPLVRAAVYHAATPGRRRAAHRALAAAGTPQTRAWHLAAAATAPDEQLAAALETLGHEARERGATATAIAVLERAAQLSPEPAQAAARTIAAAGTANVASQPARARALIEALLPTLDDPLTRADAQFVRGAAMLQSGHPQDAYALLEDEAARIAVRDPTRAALLLTQASVAVMSSGPVQRLAELAAQAQTLAPEWVAHAPAVLRAEALSGLGDHRRAKALLAEQARALHDADPVGPGHEVVSIAALSMIWMEQYDDAQRLLVRLVETARAKGAVAALALPLSVLATVHIRRAEFDVAGDLAGEAVALSDAGLEGWTRALALTAAAFVEAHRGEADACRAHAATVLELSAGLGMTSTAATGEQALGMLALGLGETETAIVHLERARAHTERFGSRDPSFLYTSGDLVDVYVRTGRDDDARVIAAELAAGAELTGGAWAAAATARSRGLLDGDERIDAHLAVALAAHARIDSPFELARTQLCFGERLRRARRRADARTLLEAAHASFTAFGTTGWAQRAAAELAATGLPRDGDATAEPTTADALTARERAVCELVAGGATNREAATALFLSPRTVEHHLRQAYRKLGVRSRTELAVRWREVG
ncbi:LuxR family transcriptional regulator [Conexibacter stalactiti]|uniref:LuxR family transcriptional regulator n=1 Tax=Conexibacter stalactiti TaxID=1940611 RepID=A0ABU4HHC7_9ACTN|nr:LuxR family transcriptional regulator [Conexibacter stalactiti]MDW5592720.1 LuxR family transcriptional regulator [Conexibacter stalactiti]MEC5033361.1 LuxR family transcriptional regulator [Conexibacter stalactiti]